MIVFSVVAALLVAAALLFIVPPLWRRNDRKSIQRTRSNLEICKDQMSELEADLRNGILGQEQFEQGRVELERRLLEEVPAEAAQPVMGDDRGAGRGAAIAVMIMVPLLAALLYVLKGNPAGINPGKVTAESVAAGNGGAAHGVTMEQIESMVAGLAARLQSNPNDAEGWKMLGRSLVALGRYDEANTALERAVAMIPNDADLLADYADALGMTSGSKSLAGKPAELVKRVLQLNPDHQKGLWLAGTVAYNTGDYKAAVSHWERLLAQLTPGSQEAGQVQGIIDEARSLASGKAPPQSAAAGTAMVGAAKVSGVVRLSPKLAGKAAPTDSVFVFARAQQGPRMPLAVLRAQVKDLPLKFTLDDSMAPAPMAKLSDFQDVIIGARISRSGNAMSQSGDLEGATDAVRVGDANVVVEINAAVQ